MRIIRYEETEAKTEAELEMNRQQDEWNLKLELKKVRKKVSENKHLLPRRTVEELEKSVNRYLKTSIVQDGPDAEWLEEIELKNFDETNKNDK